MNSKSREHMNILSFLFLEASLTNQQLYETCNSARRDAENSTPISFEEYIERPRYADSHTERRAYLEDYNKGAVTMSLSPPGRGRPLLWIALHLAQTGFKNV